MKNISLAIPFYNTSRYFLDCIKYSIHNELVSEIVVNDDNSSDQEWNNLNQIVGALNSNKIKLFRNKVNLGAFRNKYQTVSKCSNNWIYLLDSDNSPFDESYSIIKDIDDTDTSICFSPEKLFCKSDIDINFRTIAEYSFGYDIIGTEESQESISKNVKWFDWFINTGNYIFCRETYLNVLKEPYEDFSTPLLDADTAATFYFWLKNNGRFKIVNNLRHYHRLRDDSYWHSRGQNSQLSVDYYKRLILQL